MRFFLFNMTMSNTFLASAIRISLRQHRTQHELLTKSLDFWRNLKSCTGNSRLCLVFLSFSQSSTRFAIKQLDYELEIAVRLFSNRSQMTSKFGKNERLHTRRQPSVSLIVLIFLPRFDVFCDLLERLSLTLRGFTSNGKRQK